MVPVGAFLSFVGVGLMAVAYLNREDPRWQRDMRAIIVVALGQVLLGLTITLVDTIAR